MRTRHCPLMLLLVRASSAAKRRLHASQLPTATAASRLHHVRPLFVFRVPIDLREDCQLSSWFLEPDLPLAGSYLVRGIPSSDILKGGRGSKKEGFYTFRHAAAALFCLPFCVRTQQNNNNKQNVNTPTRWSSLCLCRNEMVIMLPRDLRLARHGRRIHFSIYLARPAGKGKER